MPLRQAGDNVRWILLLTEAANKHNPPSMLLYLDIKKGKLGYGEKFCTWVLHYTYPPEAQVKYAGFQFYVFFVFRGTRQGCPLSPLLFVLAIEPLAQLI